MLNRRTFLSGFPSARLMRWHRIGNQIVVQGAAMKSLSDEQIRQQSRQLRWRALSGTALSRLLVGAFALVREAASRVRGQTPYHVQLVGGIALFENSVAEMQTGEGKTLTAVLPSYLRAIVGHGCHVVTTNDYLADRDAKWNSPIFELLGLSVGCIQMGMSPQDRHTQYACDVTYGTAKEMGFDFLRDRLKRNRLEQTAQQFRWLAPQSQDTDIGCVQRGHYFALIDEADSILIDEARTPLLIAQSEPNPTANLGLYRWSVRAIKKLNQDRDFRFEAQQRSAYLTDTGCRRVVTLPKPAAIDSIDVERVYKQIERALTAECAFVRDRDYVVIGGKVSIVDESTGRLMEGRKWRDGMHQSVEAKERVAITDATKSTAKITVQSYFRQYEHLAGMTGTAATAARELKRTYHLLTSTVPTHRPCRRKKLPLRVFVDMKSKWAAVSEAVVQLQSSGRAVLIGTPSVRASEALSQLLTGQQVEHQVLNCRAHRQEAEIIAYAGQSGRVTIATNMAGRGTDIQIDDRVRQLGGLHVIATEMHSSARIDRQLIGRTARQGDLGTYQFYVSLEDELLRNLTPAKQDRLQKKAQQISSRELPHRWLRVFRQIQQTLEKRHGKQRRELLKREEERNQIHQRMGLDQYLEMSE